MCVCVKEILDSNVVPENQGFDNLNGDSFLIGTNLRKVFENNSIKLIKNR